MLAAIPLAAIALWLATDPGDRTDEPTTTAPVVRESAATSPDATEPASLAPVIDLPPSPEEAEIPEIVTQRES